MHSNFQRRRTKPAMRALGPIAADARYTPALCTQFSARPSQPLACNVQPLGVPPLASHTTRPGYHRPPSLRAARRPHVTPHSKTLQARTPTPPPALAAQSSVRYSRPTCSAFPRYHPKTTQKMYSRLDEVEKGNPVGVVVCGARDARIMRAPTPDPRPPTPTHMEGSNANREKRCSNPNPNPKPQPQPQTPLRFVVHQRIKSKRIDSTCELHFSPTLARCLIRSLSLCVFPCQWRRWSLWPQISNI